MKEQYKQLMTEYAKAFLLRMEMEEAEFELKLDGDNTIFIGDTLIYNLDDVRFAVDNNMTPKEFYEWDDYNTQALDLGLHRINIKSWHMGAPRVSKEEMNKLFKMREDFMEAINNINTLF